MDAFGEGGCVGCASSSEDCDGAVVVEGDGCVEGGGSEPLEVDGCLRGCGGGCCESVDECGCVESMEECALPV